MRRYAGKQTTIHNVYRGQGTGSSSLVLLDHSRMRSDR